MLIKLLQKKRANVYTGKISITFARRNVRWVPLRTKQRYSNFGHGADNNLYPGKKSCRGDKSLVRISLDRWYLVVGVSFLHLSSSGGLSVQRIRYVLFLFDLRVSAMQECNWEPRGDAEFVSIKVERCRANNVSSSTAPFLLNSIKKYLRGGEGGRGCVELNTCAIGAPIKYTLRPCWVFYRSVLQVSIFVWFRSLVNLVLRVPTSLGKVINSCLPYPVSKNKRITSLMFLSRSLANSLSMVNSSSLSRKMKLNSFLFSLIIVLVIK